MSWAESIFTADKTEEKINKTRYITPISMTGARLYSGNEFTGTGKGMLLVGSYGDAKVHLSSLEIDGIELGEMNQGAGITQLTFQKGFRVVDDSRDGYDTFCTAIFYE